MSENVLYLSKRNLQVLLSKLERREQGDNTACSIIKYKTPTDPYTLMVGDAEYVVVVAVSDDEFYANREPGEMHPLDTP